MQGRKFFLELVSGSGSAGWRASNEAESKRYSDEPGGKVWLQMHHKRRKKSHSVIVDGRRPKAQMQGS